MRKTIWKYIWAAAIYNRKPEQSNLVFVQLQNSLCLDDRRFMGPYGVVVFASKMAQAHKIAQ